MYGVSGREGAVADADDAGFREFVTRQRSALLRTAYLLTGDHGRAEDLVQTALLETYRRWARVSGRGDPTAYVRRAPVTTATSWRRRLSSTEQVVETLPEHGYVDHHRDRDDAVVRALRALPPRMRAVVVLRFYEDLTEAATAELLGCSVGTVKTQASRALARLRTALADQRPTTTPGGQPWTSTT
ncbi:SigE family RNA polymerase sigma factor [Geodermatophilus nigrescens]